MHDAIKAFFLVFSALFPIVDPLSASPIFLALTRSVLPATRRELSWRVTLNSFALMAGSYFLGSHLLAFFGVSLPAVQVGGGLIVCAFGWNLLMEKDGEKNATPEAVESNDISGLQWAATDGDRHSSRCRTGDVFFKDGVVPEFSWTRLRQPQIAGLKALSSARVNQSRTWHRSCQTPKTVMTNS